MTDLKNLIIFYIIKRGDTMTQTQLKPYIDGLLWLPTSDTVDVDGITRFRDSIVVHNLSEKAKVLLIDGWKDMQEMIDIIDDNLNHYNYNKTEKKWVGWSTNTQPETITLDKFLEDKEKTTLTGTITYETSGDSIVSLENILVSGKSYLFELNLNEADTTLTSIEYRFYDENNNTLQATSCRDITTPYYDIFEANEIYPKIVFTSSAEGVLDYIINIYEL